LIENTIKSSQTGAPGFPSDMYARVAILRPEVTHRISDSVFAAQFSDPRQCMPECPSESAAGRSHTYPKTPTTYHI